MSQYFMYENMCVSVAFTCWRVYYYRTILFCLFVRYILLCYFAFSFEGDSGGGAFIACSRSSIYGYRRNTEPTGGMCILIKLPLPYLYLFHASAAPFSVLYPAEKAGSVILKHTKKGKKLKQAATI